MALSEEKVLIPKKAAHVVFFNDVFYRYYYEGRLTLAVYRGDRDDENYHIQVAWCSPQDTPSKKMGRMVAGNRLYKVMMEGRDSKYGMYFILAKNKVCKDGGAEYRHLLEALIHDDEFFYSRTTPLWFRLRILLDADNCPGAAFPFNMDAVDILSDPSILKVLNGKIRTHFLKTTPAPRKSSYTYWPITIKENAD